MMSPWFSQEFNKRVKEEIVTRTEKVLDGSLSHEEYIKVTQYRRGLLAAVDIFRELENQLENE